MLEDCLFEKKKKWFVECEFCEDSMLDPTQQAVYFGEVSFRLDIRQTEWLRPAPSKLKLTSWSSKLELVHFAISLHLTGSIIVCV